MAYHNWSAMVDTEAEADERIKKFLANYPPCFGAKANKQKIQAADGDTKWWVDYSHWDCE